MDTSNEIVLSHPKIIEFYQKNTHLDPIQLNLHIIDLYDSFTKNNDIISTNHVQSMFNNIQSSIDNQQLLFTSKFYEMKSTYLDELKFILDSHSSTNILKIIEKIDHQHQELLGKTTSIFHEIIPKTHSQYYQEYEKLILQFQQEVKQHINMIKPDISLDKIHILLSKEYNQLITNIQNTIVQYISNSEDRIRNHIHDISTKQIDQEKIHQEIIQFLNLYKTPTKKGEISENMLNVMLNQLYPSAEIVHTAKQTSSGDCILVRTGKPNILFENKNYNTNVPKHEVDKFIFDIEQQNCSGIFMSQKTGIALKENFEINIHKDHVLIYIHHMNYDKEKLMIAVDIIDKIIDRFKSLNRTSFVIPIDTIEYIQSQYHSFLEKRDNIIHQLNDHTKKIIHELKELNLSNIQSILSTYIHEEKPPENKIIFSCSICNSFTTNTKRSLSSHMYSCSKKNKNI